ncbi:uncharacterized protein LOC108598674 isoform X3 [Drosophila busckii]|uniref:uncharacterized protein LOC108598674 isoform X3 n=1 Tax=Drosophila busckii TaxID=30019 RepID=UPI00083EAF6F|nr:uncharacterized protein LOC108598674 isoform X3 [Drosophila busckii]
MELENVKSEGSEPPAYTPNDETMNSQNPIVQQPGSTGGVGGCQRTPRFDEWVTRAS